MLAVMSRGAAVMNGQLAAAAWFSTLTDGADDRIVINTALV
jgi:hypothetical protein